MATAGESRQGQTSPQAIDRATRRAEAVKLRHQGHTLREIATQLGVSPATVHGDIQQALADVPAEGVQELRALWHERLEAATTVLMPQVREGNLEAVDRLIRLSQRAAQLQGLDAPTQMEWNTGADLDIDGAVQALVTAAQGGKITDLKGHDDQEADQ